MMLTSKTKLSDILNKETLKVYHASAQRVLKIDSSKGLHVGSLDQARDRADFYVNDECLYSDYHIHELTIRLPGRDNIHRVIDKGYRANIAEENSFAQKSDILVYRNVAEGKVKEQNLSLIILNVDTIESCNYFSVFVRVN